MGSCNCTLGNNQDEDLKSLQVKDSFKYGIKTSKEIAQLRKESNPAVDMSEIRDYLFKTATFDNKKQESANDVANLTNNIRDMSKFKIRNENDVKIKEENQKSVSIKNIIVPEYQRTKGSETITNGDDDSYENFESNRSNLFEFTVSKKNLTIKSSSSKL